MRMTNPRHQKLIARATLGKAAGQLGQHDAAECRDAEKQRFHYENNEDAQITGSALRGGKGTGNAGLTEPASPKKPSAVSQEDGSGKGDQAPGKERHAQYWKMLKKVTVVWMLAWTVPAIIMHLPIGVTSQVRILNGIPLHWFNAALLAIVIGIALIFMYAYVMERTDRAFRGA